MTEPKTTLLLESDLIPDARLREGDVDAFRHRPIAARVAELASVATPPTNIALFGPWGSGKSSFFELLRSELTAVDPSVRVVHYDAWKYGGAALKRNFISSVAHQLGIEDDDSSEKRRRFHGGLHEQRRTVRIDPAELWRDGKRERLAGPLLIAAVVAAIGLIAVAALRSWLGGDGFHEALGDLAPGYGSSMFAITFTLASALRILESARVEVEQAVPSADDEFSKLFNDLVEPDAGTQTEQTRVRPRSTPPVSPRQPWHRWQ